MAAFYALGEVSGRKEVRTTGPFDTYEEAVAENERIASLVPLGGRRELQTVVFETGSFIGVKRGYLYRLLGHLPRRARRNADEWLPAAAEGGTKMTRDDILDLKAMARYRL